MALIYDKALFGEFRAKAITRVEDLEIGKVYYGNSIHPFILSGIISNKELWTRRGRPDIAENKSDEKLTWITGYANNMVTSPITISLHDHNIEASYNPWLIFDNEEIANECRERLLVTFRNDSWYDEEWW